MWNLDSINVERNVQESSNDKLNAHKKVTDYATKHKTKTQLYIIEWKTNCFFLFPFFMLSVPSFRLNLFFWITWRPLGWRCTNIQMISMYASKRLIDRTQQQQYQKCDWIFMRSKFTFIVAFFLLQNGSLGRY